MLAGLFTDNEAATTRDFTRYAVVEDGFLNDCEPEIAAGLRVVARELEALGFQGASIDTGWWAESFEIFAPIQAWEAARIHAGHFDRFEPSIRERLQWGARITAAEIDALRLRRANFNARMDELFATHQLLLLPASPTARLAAGADHSQTRVRLLRYTTPFSVAGVPIVTIPSTAGGMQLAAARECDEALLQLAARLGARRKTASYAPTA